MESRITSKGEKGGKRGNCWFEGKSSPFTIPVMLGSLQPLLFERTPGARESGLLALKSESSSSGLLVGTPGGGNSLSSSPSSPPPSPYVPHPQLPTLTCLFPFTQCIFQTCQRSR